MGDPNPISHPGVSIPSLYLLRSIRAQKQVSRPSVTRAAVATPCEFANKHRANTAANLKQPSKVIGNESKYWKALARNDGMV